MPTHSAWTSILSLEPLASSRPGHVLVDRLRSAAGKVTENEPRARCANLCSLSERAQLRGKLCSQQTSDLRAPQLIAPENPGIVIFGRPALAVEECESGIRLEHHVGLCIAPP